MKKRNFQDYSEEQPYSNTSSDVYFTSEEDLNCAIIDEESSRKIRKFHPTHTIHHHEEDHHYHNQEDNPYYQSSPLGSNSDIHRTTATTVESTFSMSDLLINSNMFHSVDPAYRLHLLECTDLPRIVKYCTYPFYNHCPPSPQVLNVTPTRINELDSYCWLNIISFIGIEEFFIHKLYLINMNACERMFKSANFWDLFFEQLWKGDRTPEQFDWKCKRRYCFVRYFKYQSQQQLNPHVQTGRISSNDVPQHHIVANPIHLDFNNQCFVTKMFEPECYHFSLDHFGYISNMNWQVTIFLKESPVFFHLILKTQIEYQNGQRVANYGLHAFIPYRTEPIEIFGERIVAKRGIKFLFQSLGLSEEVNLTCDELDLRFSYLSFGPLMNDRYFIWFCNSVLSFIPFPIEDSFGFYDETKSLNYGVNDLINEKVALMLKVSSEYDLNISYI